MNGIRSRPFIASILTLQSFGSCDALRANSQSPKQPRLLYLPLRYLHARAPKLTQIAINICIHACKCMRALFVRPYISTRARACSRIYHTEKFGKCAYRDTAEWPLKSISHRINPDENEFGCARVTGYQIWLYIPHGDAYSVVPHLASYPRNLSAFD